jgi:hypothetical protein
MTPKHACNALNELGSALSEATRLVKELASEFKHLTKTLADGDAAHTEGEGARDFNQSLKIAAHRTVEKPLRSDACTSVQQPQTQLEVEVQCLTTALAESNSDSSLQQHFVDWKIFDGCVQALKQLDEKSLKEEFQHFADKRKDENSAAEEASRDALDNCRMSKQGLAALFAARKKTLSEGEVKELMMRIDTGGDGEVDWHEFRALVRSTSDLEMLFKSFPLALVLAFGFPTGSTDAPLKPFFGMQRGEVVSAVQKAAFILVDMTMDVIDKQNAAEKKKAADGGGGGKFGAELQGRDFHAFFQGVTAIVGEPHPG